MAAPSAPAPSCLAIGGETYHLTWLRDNCTCAQCRDPSSFQKLFDISLAGRRPAMLRHAIDGDTLHIVWDEAPLHESRYSLAWLARQPVRIASIEQQVLPALWGADTWNQQPLPWHALPAEPSDTQAWQNDLLRLGFVLFRDVELDALDRFVSSIGPIHYTEYGRFAHIRSSIGAQDLSESGCALTPHTDYSTYMHTAPLLQFLYFKVNAASGGETVLVDGFQAATDFRRDHPDAFSILVETPIEFQQFYQGWRYHFIRRRPIIELNEAGDISGVFFGHSHCFNWKLAPERVDAFYEAYVAFFRYLKHLDYQLVVKLQAGECVAVQNGRLLHGRRAFDPTSGDRHLIDAYVPWEYFIARLNFLRDQADFCADSCVDSCVPTSPIPAGRMMA